MRLQLKHGECPPGSAGGIPEEMKGDLYDNRLIGGIGVACPRDVGLVDFAEVSDPLKLSDLFAKPHHIHSLRPAFVVLHIPAPDLASTNMHAALDGLLDFPPALTTRIRM